MMLLSIDAVPGHSFIVSKAIIIIIIIIIMMMIRGYDNWVSRSFVHYFDVNNVAFD